MWVLSGSDVTKYITAMKDLLILSFTSGIAIINFQDGGNPLTQIPERWEYPSKSSMDKEYGQEITPAVLE